MRNLKLKTLLALVTLSIGVLAYYCSGLPRILAELKRLESNAADVAAVYSSYAFTVAGFLATIATFLYTLGGKPYFELYRRRGNFGDLMFLHALTLIVLAALFVVAILMHSHPHLIRIGSVLAGVSILQLVLLTFVSYNLSNRSNAN